MRRIVPAILLVAVLAVGGGLLVNAAYDAGVHTAVTTAVDNGARVAAPVVVPPYGYGYGYGWHPFGWGFSIFGVLFGLFFLFLIFGLIRAIFWGGRRGWGPGGWGEPGHHANGGRYDRNPWIERFGPSFEEWHRQAHGSSTTPGSSNEPPASNQGSTPA